MPPSSEQQRMIESDSGQECWHRWGPYLSERAWGTVREDYSADGNAWTYFPHDHARSRVYRWSEDGIAGISDDKQRLCFAFAFWNGRDAILKERLFGVTAPQGNHGEDVKEIYFYKDSTPTHSYMQMTYRYPQAAFPYNQLLAENANRPKWEREFELWDTGILEQGFFDIDIEYAKVTPEDFLIRAAAKNCGDTPATLHMLPTLWFRNTWSWGRDKRRPRLREMPYDNKNKVIEAQHHILGEYRLYCEEAGELLFTENESNATRLWRVADGSSFAKDAFNDYLINNRREASNPAKTGTKAAAHWKLQIDPGQTKIIRLRLRKIIEGELSFVPFARFDQVVDARLDEAHEFFDALAPASLTK